MSAAKFSCGGSVTVVLGWTLGCRGKSLSWTVSGQTRFGWLIVLPLVAEISLSEANICIFSHQLAFGRITVIEPEENKLFTIFHFLQVPGFPILQRVF